MDWLTKHLHPTPADVQSTDAQFRATLGAGTTVRPRRVPQQPARADVPLPLDAQLRNAPADVVDQDATSSNALDGSPVLGPDDASSADETRSPFTNRLEACLRVATSLKLLRMAWVASGT